MGFDIIDKIKTTFEGFGEAVSFLARVLDGSIDAIIAILTTLFNSFYEIMFFVLLFIALAFFIFGVLIFIGTFTVSAKHYMIIDDLYETYKKQGIIALIDRLKREWFKIMVRPFSFAIREIDFASLSVGAGIKTIMAATSATSSAVSTTGETISSSLYSSKTETTKPETLNDKIKNASLTGKIKNARTQEEYDTIRDGALMALEIENNKLMFERDQLEDEIRRRKEFNPKSNVSKLKERLDSVKTVIQVNNQHIEQLRKK